MPNNVDMETKSPVEKAAQIVGGLTTLANLVGVSVPTVYEWKTFKRPVPILRCISISKLTQGEVTLQSLRPNDWHLIWPELATQPQSHPAAQEA